MVSPVAAIDIGLVAGVLVTYMIEIFELRLHVDDPGGAVSVHALSGIWGLIALGLFGHFAQGSRGGHILAQLVGVSALLGFVLPLVHAGNLLLNRFAPYRVDDDGHWQGRILNLWFMRTSLCRGDEERLARLHSQLERLALDESSLRKRKAALKTQGLLRSRSSFL
jgi:hypothetical protein